MAARIQNITQTQCQQFLSRPNVNPITGRSINIDGPTYKQLQTACAKLGIMITSPDVKPPVDGIEPITIVPGSPPRPAPPTPTIHPTIPPFSIPFQPEETIRGQYQLIRELGSGSFGVTFLARDNVRGQDVAIKTINRTKFGTHVNIGDIEDEVATLQEISRDGCYQYLLCYLDSFTETWHGDPTTFVVTEFIEGPSLYEFRRSMNGRTPRAVLIPLMLQLLLGLKSIHDEGYAHRDIKTANIMFPRRQQIKYIDFGFACVEACRIANCHNVCRGEPGSLMYTPPEYYYGEVLDTLARAQAHDIWSLGIVFYELTNERRYPFDHNVPTREVHRNIRTAPAYPSEYRYDFPDQAISVFIERMLTTNWELRPNILQIIDLFIQTVAIKIQE